ncbi:MAG: ABC transporter ATP-binding protein [Desulfamplus sp.]|nr:ABC transporter ATP-binding protein [Desulfamplus sp.]
MDRELVVKNLWFKDESGDILKDINISINRGKTLALLGPSGCGKTTLLRIIAGLEEANSGQIFFRGQNMASVPPYKRDFGMMFQDFALFPHRDVFKNISFGLEMKKFSKKKIESRVKEMLELVNLEHCEKREIRELSGGERQRVALARTLAPFPQLIMLDEPLGSLDRGLRERLLADLCLILKKSNQNSSNGNRATTIIWVTHDHNEAFAVSDLVSVMSQGEVLQIDSPQNLYHFPANKRVAKFLGFENIVGKDCLTLIMPDAASTISEDEFLQLNQTDNSYMTISGLIIDTLFQGDSSKISTNVFLPKEDSSYNLNFNIPSNITIPKIGDRVFLKINPKGIKKLTH